MKDQNQIPSAILEELFCPEETSMPETAANWLNPDPPVISSINQLAGRIHRNAVDHGWYDESRTFGDIIALCHSELSEALEEHRNGKGMLYIVDNKPEGIAVEMIDCVIRIFDYLASKDVDIDYILNLKNKYNETRPYKHGGKKL